MATALIPLIYDELLDYLLQKAAPDEILAFTASPQAEARAEYLLERNNSGVLTDAEKLELEQMLHFDRKISVLKARAAVHLKLSHDINNSNQGTGSATSKRAI